MDFEEILTGYYRKKGTRSVAKLFERYMAEIGAKRLDRRRKDTSNTYMIDGGSTNWRRVECYYYRNSGDFQKYGCFDIKLALRKRGGSYFLIEAGSPDRTIRRSYEISSGRVIRCDKELLEEIVGRHFRLFEMMSEELEEE